MQIVIDDKKIIDLLEMEWGYEGIREDIARVIRENGIPLDKIRAEIEEAIKVDPYRLYAAIEIIDKYKAESEEQE